MEEFPLCILSNKDSKTYQNLLEYQQDYLEALESSPNIENQLICWFQMATKPVLMLMHANICLWVQLFG